MTKLALFLDTTIQVDRLAGEHDDYISRINDLLGGYHAHLACTFSRLEYKRVVIRNLALILSWLCEEKSFWGAIRRAQAMVAHQRRGSTLISLAVWLGQKLDSQIEVQLGDGLDQQLAQRAETYLRNAIKFLWKRFDSTLTEVTDRTECARAKEGPRRTSGNQLDVTIPQSRCRNQECNNGNFFRSQLPRLRQLCGHLEKIEQGGGTLTPELQKSLTGMKAAIQNPSRLYDYNRCLEIGDVWIHLECLVAGAKDFTTTNYKESQVLCPALQLQMIVPGKK